MSGMSRMAPGVAATPGQRWLAPGVLAGMIIALDQLAKLWAIQTLGPNPGDHELFLFGDWFSLVYLQNTGVAFGLFRNMTHVFTVTSLLISAAAIYAYLFYLPNMNPWVQISMGLILGGGLGNVIDRIRLGFVVDFIRVGWWPVFNIADSAITVGVSMLAIFLLFASDDEPAPAPPRDDALLRQLLDQEVAQPDDGGERPAS